LEVLLLHVAAHLIWDFLENLLGEVTLLHALVVLNELDDIPLGCVTSVVSEDGTVSIEFLHGAEVCVADTDDNDGAWHAGKLDDQSLGGRHVVDCSISQEKEDLVDHTLLHGCLHAHLELLEKWCEQGRAAETDLWECLSVSCEDVLDGENLRVRGVAVHGEAVIYTINTHVSWNSTEAEEWEHLV